MRGPHVLEGGGCGTDLLGQGRRRGRQVVGVGEVGIGPVELGDSSLIFVT